VPELPEVETIAKQLDLVLAQRTIAQVEVRREKSARSGLDVLNRKQIKRVERLAKMIVVVFETGDRRLLIHLKMTGQLIFVEKEGNDRVVGGHPSGDWVGQLPSTHTRIIVRFEDGARLYFNDMRVFGWWRVVSGKELMILRGQLPPDVVDKGFGVEYLGGVLGKSTRAVKLVILDQAKMGGMGNIYANDALWLAQIDPFKPAKDLGKQEVEKLHEAMVKVLKKGIELGGASYSNYVDIAGMGGKYQEHFLAYGREGERCLKKGCGSVMVKAKLGGRGTYWCPKCQRRVKEVS